MAANRRLLMLSFQFPPFGQSTGPQRTLSFARYLPRFGWHPIVITARASAFPLVDLATLRSIPPGTQVIRAFGFDIARVASIKGLYPGWLATPDRWNSWIIGAVLAGWREVRKSTPSAIWATFPTPSAIAAALLLRRLTGLPLIADLRDPLIYESWPAKKWDRFWYGRLERSLVRHATAIVLTTPSADRYYRDRFPQFASKFHVIPNGMEASAAQASKRTENIVIPGRIVLLHSGLMELPDRDPTAFFTALSNLAASNALPRDGLRVVLRASGREQHYTQLAQSLGISQFVELVPRVSRDQAIEEMCEASALLLFQGKHCNRQIPAKVYEYLFAGKPIVGLADSAGDTRDLLERQWGVPYCADMDDPEAISKMLTQMFADFSSNRPFVPDTTLREKHTREAQSRLFVDLLEKCAPADGQELDAYR